MAVQYAFAKIVTDGLALAVDAADPNSYPGTGTTWRDVTPNNNSGTITGSVAYSTAYKGGLVFSGPTASVTFSTASANFGTGSFTVEMAFSPSYINGIHYLASKNSGSFPNWGIYLSGSNGSGKLYSEFKISSTVSSSISSSTTFVTGSVYQVDVRILPAFSASGFYIDGVSIGGGTGSAAGSLTNTGSLFLGNSAPSSSQSFSGSIYATKIYLNATVEQPSRNFNAIAPRFSKQLITDTAKKQYELLAVGAGGGSGGTGPAGGGGGGGLVNTSLNSITAGTYTIIVGSGSLSSGSNSVFGSIIALGGGNGRPGANGANGGSGGGGGGYNPRTGGSGSVGQGFAGGNNIKPSNPTQPGAYNGSAAGGGAGGPGSDATSDYIGAPGGSGSYVASFAAIGGLPAGWFAGGGGGGDISSINASYIPNFYGGIGGGGTGSYGSGAGINASPGIANTGGGAGGTGASNTGAIGGTGIVAIRYNGAPIAIGGEITQSAGYTYHVFRTVGTSSFIIF